MPQAADATDEVLLRRAREGDASAFRAIVERYEGTVAATVVGMLGRGPDADDVGQETFIRLYQALDRFRGESSLKTYLTRIAINQSLKALRKKQRFRLRFFSREETGIEDTLHAIEANDDIGDRERTELVHQALQVLSPEHRSVVVLRILEGYDTKETAEMLGIPPGTVMSRLARALEKLEPVLRPVRDV